MPPMGFEPTTSAGELPKAYPLLDKLSNPLLDWLTDLQTNWAYYINN